MSKLDIMKKEYAEILQKLDNLYKKGENLRKNYENRREKEHPRYTQVEIDKSMVKYSEKTTEIMTEMGKLTALRDELRHKILIREEALDLLKELGLYSDAPKEKSRISKLLSIF
jgi:hypothetical protein